MRGGDWGVEGDWRPLPTRLQRYCDLASLVPVLFLLHLLRNAVEYPLEVLSVNQTVHLLVHLSVGSSVR